MALFQGETTAWEDIQIKLGNFRERDPKGPSLEETSRETIAKAENIARQDFVNKLLLENQEEEDTELVALRRSRLEQLMRQDAQSLVRRITKESYLDEVTEGSKSAVIVVMMDRGGGSSFLELELKKFAQKWNDSVKTRFYMGDIDDLIGINFPSTSLPFAVIYSDGSCQFQLQNATIQGIKNSLSAITRSRSSRHSDDQQVQEDSLTRDIRKEIAARRAFNRVDESSDSDSDGQDDRKYQSSKGYSDLGFERNVLRYR